jgi:Arc/MetJ family transcription regulator
MIVSSRTSIRISAPLVDEAVKILGVKSPVEAVRVALREVLSLKPPKRKERLKLADRSELVSRRARAGNKRK